MHGMCDIDLFRLDVADTEGKKALKALSCGVPRKVQVIPPLKLRVAHENHHRNPGKYHPKWWIFHGCVSLQECKSCELLVLLSPELFDKMDTLEGM